MKKILAILALVSIISFADADAIVGRPGVRGAGVGAPGVGVTRRPVARAAVASSYVEGQTSTGSQTYPASYSPSRPVARGAMVRGVR